jgi:hypothetical protein
LPASLSQSRCFSVGKRWVPSEAAASKAAHCNTFEGGRWGVGMVCSGSRIPKI